MGIRELVKIDNAIYGVDTETYNNPSYGLKSIQAWGLGQPYYFTVDDWELSDDEIRFNICKQFIDWLDELSHNCTLAFFNIDFDFSQFAYYLICQSQFNYVDHDQRLARNEVRILESDTTLYKVEMVNQNGKRIVMIDIGNFLTSTTLNKACQDWIGKSKIELESKDFRKRPASDIEKQYAIEDAKLTYELYNCLIENNVIEGRTVTIAGRTIKHFKDYLKKNYGLSFERWAWGTDDQDLIGDYSAMAE